MTAFEGFLNQIAGWPLQGAISSEKRKETGGESPTKDKRVKKG